MIIRKLLILIFIITLTGINLSFAQDDTEKFFIDQIKENPNFPDNYYNIGTYYFTHKNKKSIQYLIKAIELKPDYYDAHSNLGNAYEFFNEKELALKEYKKANELKPNKELQEKIILLQNQTQTTSSNTENKQIQNQDSSEKSVSKNEDKKSLDENSTDNLTEESEISEELTNFIIMTLIIIGGIVIPAFFLWLSGVLNNALNVTYLRSIFIMIIILFILTFYHFLTISNQYINLFRITLVAIPLISISSLFEINFLKSIYVLVLSAIGATIFDMILILLLTAIFGSAWHTSMPDELTSNKYYNDTLTFCINQLKEMKLIARVDYKPKNSKKNKAIAKNNKIETSQNTPIVTNTDAINQNVVNKIPVMNYKNIENINKNIGTPQNLQLKENLFSSIREKNIQKVKEIIDSGYDINSNEPSYLIWQATNSWNTEIMKILIEKCNDINIKGHNMVTLLMTAAMKGDLEITKLLIQKGCSVNDLDADGSTALYFSANGDGNIEVIKLLIQNNANVNSKNNNGRTPLMAAANNEYYFVAQTLIENGAEINAQDKNGMTALMTAVKKPRNINVVKLLLEKGSDTSLKDFKYGKTAFEMANYNI